MVKLNPRSDRGSAFVELALVLPLLSLVLVGAAELGRIAYFAIEVSNAARAGAAYGSQNSSTAANDATHQGLVKSAALADAPELAQVAGSSFQATVATLEDCETVNSDGSVTESVPVPYPMATACTSITGQTNTIVNYVKVTTTAQVSTMFRYPGIPTSFTLSGSAQMRVLQN